MKGFQFFQFPKYGRSIFQIFEDQCSNFAWRAIILTIFSVKRHLDTWMINLNFRNRNVRFPPKYQALNFEISRYVVKLENWKPHPRNFGKLEKPSKIGSRQTNGLHSMEPNCINVLAELAVFLLKIPRFWVRWENN